MREIFGVVLLGDVPFLPILSSTPIGRLHVSLELHCVDEIQRVNARLTGKRNCYSSGSIASFCASLLSIDTF